MFSGELVGYDIAGLSQRTIQDATNMPLPSRRGACTFALEVPGGRRTRTPASRGQSVSGAWCPGILLVWVEDV